MCFVNQNTLIFHVVNISALDIRAKLRVKEREIRIVKAQKIPLFNRSLKKPIMVSYIPPLFQKPRPQYQGTLCYCILSLRVNLAFHVLFFFS